MIAALTTRHRPHIPAGISTAEWCNQASHRGLCACAGVLVHAATPKPVRVLPSGPPEQSQVQRVIQRMQKKDPYRIFAEVPSEEMVRPLLFFVSEFPPSLHFCMYTLFPEQLHLGLHF